jgi:hypothetical protein
MPPQTKTCPKMVLPIKGGSLCVKAVCKKIFGAVEHFAGGSCVRCCQRTESKLDSSVKTRQHDLAFASRDIGAEGGEDVADLLVLDGLVDAVSVPGRR